VQVVLGIVAVVIAIVNVVFAAIGLGNFFAMIASGIWTGLIVRCCSSKDLEATGTQCCSGKSSVGKKSMRKIDEKFKKKIFTKK